MLVWVGLGNPEPGMARHRHNIGFMAIERIAQRHRFGPWRSRFKGLAAEGSVGGARVLALKPMTYMNVSGEAAQAATAFLKVPPEDVVAFYDELDLAPGKVRVKRGGGAAGHNGIRSLDRHLPAPDYRRVRLGIGHPGMKERVTGHVLGDFSKADTWLDPLLDAVADAAPLLAQDRDADFMTRVAFLMEAVR